MGSDATPTIPELVAWRSAAHVLNRVAVAATGSKALGQAVDTALAGALGWPAGATGAQAPPTGDAPAVVYEGSGELAPGAARIVVTAWTHAPERAVAAADALGGDRGPLSSRLAALEAPARLQSVVATAHVDGGCLSTTIDMPARALAADAPARIATAAALARQEIAVQIADAAARVDLGQSLAARAADPREAAERAAWWSLARGHADARPGEAREQILVGVAERRDAAGASLPAMSDAIRKEIDRATIAWQAPVVEARTLVERGQGEVWVLLGSTCGTLPETSGDAGASAAVATAAAARADGAAADSRAEPFVAADGIGVLAHGAARDGESPQAHARRLADVAARAFAADPLDPGPVVVARTSLLARAGSGDARALGALGNALAPGHPSWVDATGTAFGLASTTDEAVALRASAMRTGPLRVAVIANVDEAQADAAVRAVDRWIARRPVEDRACPAAPILAPTRPGTYAVEVASGEPSEAILAFPLDGEEATRAAATWTAAAFDGPDGLLARALGGGEKTAALANAWSATVLGLPRSPALAVRIVGPEALLDSAVAQTRALFDRVRQGALRDEDRGRAAAWLGRATLGEGLDPRARIMRLWRGDATSAQPSLADLHAFAARFLHDEGLVIVAARPPRLPASPLTTRRTAGKSRE
jgi:hypothetical protein